MPSAHLAGFRQVGHLGTLDPLATGVLVVLLGPRQRGWFNSILAVAKRYTPLDFVLGFATDFPTIRMARQRVPIQRQTLDAATLERFCRRTHRPASRKCRRFFSAKKVNGRPAYELARKKKGS